MGIPQNMDLALIQPDPLLLAIQQIVELLV